MPGSNFFADLNPPKSGERFDILLQHRNLVIERIVSAGEVQSSEYIQTQDEWVVLLQGEASLDVAGKTRHLAAGDYLFLPAGTPHRILSTAAGTLWLAVHLHAEPDQVDHAPSD